MASTSINTLDALMVAEYKGTQYATLEEAINAANSNRGGTITLLADIGTNYQSITFNQTLEIKSSITIDGKDYKIFANLPKLDYFFTINTAGITFTLNNFIISLSSSQNESAVINICTNSTVKIDKSFLYSTCRSIMSSSLSGSTLNIYNSNIITNMGSCINLAQEYGTTKKQSAVNIKNTKVISRSFYAIYIDCTTAILHLSGVQLYGIGKNRVIETRYSGSYGKFYLSNGTIIGGTYNITLPNGTTISTTTKPSYGVYSTVNNTHFYIDSTTCFDVTDYHVRINRSDPFTLSDDFDQPCVTRSRLESSTSTYHRHWVYPSLTQAVKATNSDTTDTPKFILLHTDITQDEPLTITEDVTINGDNHKITTPLNLSNNLFIVKSNCTLENCTIISTPTCIYSEKTINLIINNSTIFSKEFYAISLKANTNITITDSTLTSGGVGIIYCNQYYGKINLKGTTCIDIDSDLLDTNGVTTSAKASMYIQGLTENAHTPYIYLYDQAELTSGEYGHLYYSFSLNAPLSRKKVIYSTNYKGNQWYNVHANSTRDGQVWFYTTIEEALNNENNNSISDIIFLGKDTVFNAETYILLSKYTILYSSQTIDDSGIIRNTPKTLSNPQGKITPSFSVIRGYELIINNIKVLTPNINNQFVNITHKTRQLTYHETLNHAMDSGFKTFALSEQSEQEAINAGHTIIDRVIEDWSDNVWREIRKKEEDRFANTDLNTLWNIMHNSVQYITNTRLEAGLIPISNKLIGYTKLTQNKDPETLGDCLIRIGACARYLKGQTETNAKNSKNTLSEIVEMLDSII